MVITMTAETDEAVGLLFWELFYLLNAGVICLVIYCLYRVLR